MHGKAVSKSGRRPRAIKLIGLLAVALVAAEAGAQVVLNELMADNRGSVAHGAEPSDWIELHNAGSSTVSLAGMSLTDDELLPRQFVFPAGTIIPAKDYLIVWCSTNTAVPGLRASFGLGSKTDRVWLLAADGVTVMDQISYGLQAPDLSIGRIPNGAGPWKLNEPTPEGPNQVQGLAVPDWLRINEWLAMPGTGNDDWLEVYNGASLPVELSGLVITDRPGGAPTNRSILALSFIGAHGFVPFFASDLNERDADHLDFKLGSGGEALTIYATNRATVIDRITFGQQAPLTSQGRAPDGGPSIVSFQPALVTPGAPNFAAMMSVVISEVLSHTDPPLEDAIELYNNSDQSVNIGYWWLSDAASDLKKYQIPAGTTIAPRGYAVFYAFQFGSGPRGFTFNSYEGDGAYLSVGDAAGNLNGQQASVQFGALINGVSVGRYQTSVGWEFVPQSRRTFGADNPGTLNQFRSGTGASNTAPRVGPVVINEILPRTPAGAALEVEYLELHNPTTQSVPLYDPLYPANQWRIRKGISYRFPANTSLPAGGYLLLVNFDPVANSALAGSFRQTFAVPASVPIFGPYEGRLSDAGEELEMQWPDKPEPPDSEKPGFVPYELVERIHYGSNPGWPIVGATMLQSLQRRTALAFGNEPLNWFASAPTAGRANVADHDGDQMADDWELANNLDPRSPADAAGDGDGDGATNLEEYLMGTHPQQAGSVFRLDLRRLQNGAPVLEFLVQPDREYRVESVSAWGQTWQIMTNFSGVTEAGVRLVPVPAGSAPSYFRLSGKPVP